MSLWGGWLGFLFNSIFAYTLIQIMTLHQAIYVSPFSLLVKIFLLTIWFFCLSQIIFDCALILMASTHGQFFFVSFNILWLSSELRKYHFQLYELLFLFHIPTWSRQSSESLLYHAISLPRTHHSLPIAFKIKSKFLPQPTKAMGIWPFCHFQ